MTASPSMLTKTAVLALAAIVTPLSAMAEHQTSGPQRPVLIDAPQPFPTAALTLGHTGTILVGGILGVDGRLQDLKIKKSSGSDILDHAALDAVRQWTFSPAKNEAGTPISTPLTVDVEYTRAFDDGYDCSQFVRDSEWHDTVRGRDRRDELRIYKTLRGFDFIAQSNGGDFDARWDRLITYCRTHLKQRFRKAFEQSS